jgi:hypothetical protein
MKGLHFDPEKHKYYLDGKELPGVTRIIGQFKDIRIGELRYKVDTYTGMLFDAEPFEKGADRGTAIHNIAAVIAGGSRVNLDRLHPALLPAAEAYPQFLSDYQIKPLLIEEPMASVKWRYAGTVDLVANLLGRTYLIDIKSGVLSWSAGPQTAAYEQLYRESSGFTGKIVRAVAIPPMEEGKEWKLKALDKPYNRNDWRFFKARLEQHYYMERIK